MPSNTPEPDPKELAATTPGTLLANGTLRVESDSIGKIAVPAAHLWGAQTQRSLHHFSIGRDLFPPELYHAYGLVKKAAALANERLGKLPPEKAALIIRASDEVIDGGLDAEFPLHVWQTGSGTQSNMNVNEVIANRAIQLAGGTLGSKSPIHPNDDVNLSQSSNDSFPTAMHVAAALQLRNYLLPRADLLVTAIESKSAAWSGVIKIGRTHLQDAVPLTVGQEWSAFAAQLRDAIARIESTLPGLYELAAGGTAVGTGLNAPAGFDQAIASELASLTGLPFVPAPNKFAALSSLDAILTAHAALRGLAAALLKIANDIRWLASGPRCGLGELILPANEPGSSIMPGKVNPTQCEALIMLATQVIGNDAAIAVAGTHGNLQLNTMRPVAIHNFLHSVRILADGCESFRIHCIEGTQLDEKKIAAYVNNSLMLVTALTPAIGYDKAAQIAHVAHHEGITLKQAALKSGFIDEPTFDRLADPATMIPGRQNS